MKRMFSILLTAALVLSLLPACKQQEANDPAPLLTPEPTDSAPMDSAPVDSAPVDSAPVDSAPSQEALSARDVLLGVWAGLGFELTNAETYGISDGDGEDMLSVYIEGAYGLSAGEWEDAALTRETGASAVELTVLRFADEDGAKHGEDCLKEYLHRREGDFTGYAPDQAKLVADAALCWEGWYVGLFICEDSAFAGTAFTDIVRTGELPGMSQPASTPEPEPTSESEPTSEPEPTPEPEPTATPEPNSAPEPTQDVADFSNRVKFTLPGKDDMSLYDTSAIRDAWAIGDSSGLSEYDRETYDAAREILGEILTNGMTDLEKETAIYGWLVNNVDYDWRHQDVLATTPRSSYEPHGGLVDRTAVCLGYATSFQLLMDLARVECMTVTGAAFNSEEDHGWNMVRLNGNWYCVDVTWDANMREQIGPGEPENWRYFNVTSDRMAKTNHQWDYSSIPEATDEDQGRG